MTKISEYPADWPAIALRIKNAANWNCERCGYHNDYLTGHVLTVHHLDGNKLNSADWNLAALCQKCHLTIQGRIKMDQMFFGEILDVSPWFRPHLEGYLKSKNL
jgi:5-methylcytosine-specific restriction endonuclease McrA